MANDHMKIFNLSSTNEKWEECSVTWKCLFHIFKWKKSKNMYTMIPIWLKLCVYQNVDSDYLWGVDVFQMTFNFLFYTCDLDYVSFMPLFFCIFQFFLHWVCVLIIRGNFSHIKKYQVSLFILYTILSALKTCSKYLTWMLE